MKLSINLVGAIIVWVGILSAAVVLAGTPYFVQLLPIMSGGVVWFVVLVPGAMGRSARSEGEA